MQARQRYSFLTMPLSSSTDADMRPRFGAGSLHRWQTGGCVGGFEFRLVSAFGRAIIIVLMSCVWFLSPEISPSGLSFFKDKTQPPELPHSSDWVL